MRIELPSKFNEINFERGDYALVTMNEKTEEVLCIKRIDAYLDHEDNNQIFEKYKSTDVGIFRCQFLSEKFFSIINKLDLTPNPEFDESYENWRKEQIALHAEDDSWLEV